MWIASFVRCSTSISRWSLRFICDECKRHRYILSFSPLLFINTRKINNDFSLNNYDWKKNEDDERKYYRRSTLIASSIIGALTSAAVAFSWENNGVSDEELYVYAILTKRNTMELIIFNLDNKQVLMTIYST
jgi:hypothetical protein